MKDIAQDLLAEYDELAGFASKLSPDQWNLTTAFFDWTPWDEIAHLCYMDEASLLSAQGEAAFGKFMKALMQRLMRGEQLSAIARDAYGHLSGAALLDHWVSAYRRLVEALAILDPKDRLPWFGPSMSARSFATARLMETWAHGQDIYDAARVTRNCSDRLRHVAHIGVTTYGWAFANRKLEAPLPVPYVELSSPQGVTWSWGERSEANFVKGRAEDFCLVVTQRRHVNDTTLSLAGDNATAWMAIAQCFAGPPVDGPAPGVRKWSPC